MAVHRPDLFRKLRSGQVDAFVKALQSCQNLSIEEFLRWIRRLRLAREQVRIRLKKMRKIRGQWAVKRRPMAKRASGAGVKKTSGSKFSVKKAMRRAQKTGRQKPQSYKKHTAQSSKKILTQLWGGASTKKAASVQPMKIRRASDLLATKPVVAHLVKAHMNAKKLEGQMQTAHETGAGGK